VDLIEGRNPVREALRAGRRVRRLLVSSEAEQRGALAEILRLARDANIRVDRVPRRAIDARAESGAHQGVLAEVDEYGYRSWREGLENARKQGESAMFLAIDHVTDPGNLGSLLRSAEVFGAHAVLLPSRRSAQLGPVVEKAAAGAVEHLVIDRVTNLERALAECREAGLWIVGLDPSGEKTLDSLELLDEPVVLTVGSEGSGLSRLVRERSDALVEIPVIGRVASLSAPVAGAIALYEGRKRRAKARKG
jgi:23S rRNA (guanosine2251-2'-O)-methyltransferase